MRVRLLDGVIESALEPGKEHVVVSLEVSKSYRKYRIFSETRKSPILFSWDMFEVVAHETPEIWNCYYNNERSFMKICPPSWAVDGFWEDYFDADPEAIKIFTRDLRIIEEQSR